MNQEEANKSISILGVLLLLDAPAGIQFGTFNFICLIKEFIPFKESIIRFGRSAINSKVYFHIIAFNSSYSTDIKESN